MTSSVAHEGLVQDWMISPVCSVDQTSSVRDALELMKREKLTSIPVVDSSGVVKGIVTLGDVARVVLSTDKLLESNYPHYDDCLWAVDLIQQRFGSDKVTALMTERVSTIDAKESMSEAARKMVKAEIRHLVVASDGHLIGVLSANDFVRFVASGTSQAS